MPHYALESMSNWNDMTLSPDAWRDHKKLMEFLFHVKSNLETHQAALFELSAVVKKETKRRPLFTDMVEEFNC